MSRNVKELGTNALFTEYLNVVNRALNANRGKFPWKQLREATSDLAEGKKFGIAVYTSDKYNPHDWFTVSYDDGQFDLEGTGKKDTDIDWKVSRQYLEKVVESPEKYVESPSKLDFDWIVDRLGLSIPKKTSEPAQRA